MFGLFKKKRTPVELPAHVEAVKRAILDVDNWTVETVHDPVSRRLDGSSISTKCLTHVPTGFAFLISLSNVGFTMSRPELDPIVHEIVDLEAKLVNRQNAKDYEGIVSQYMK